jgi:hypothetical protein
MTAPSRNETSVFMMNVPFEDLSPPAFRNAHANKVFLAQRRKGAKKAFRNAAALCVFAPLREKYSEVFA